MATANTTKRVCVLVLGDIGRSPRMQYHSLSLSQAGFSVDIVAYQESIPHQKLTSDERITIHSIPQYSNIQYLPMLVNYAFKILHQFVLLLWILIHLPRPSHLLVQNPPSIPALPVAWLVCRLKRCTLVIDWHNYGFSIFALTHGKNNKIVRLYRLLEFSLGKLSDHALCVSEAMEQDLLQHNISKEVAVLYDRPYSFFQSMSIEEKHHFLLKFQNENPELSCDIEGETLFTSCDPFTGKAELKKNAPVVVLSSTSWTKDEDFSVLLKSLHEFDLHYAEKLITTDNALKVVCIITGKGPMKTYYMQKLSQYHFKNTRFLFPWLAAEDYPKILACATVGICLHTSSSGLDLPMKVVDMFGSRLPVCAYDYPCIHELVLENQNGLLFSNSENLLNCLVTLLEDFPKCELVQKFRTNLETNFCKLDWDHNWRQKAAPIFVN